MRRILLFLLAAAVLSLAGGYALRSAVIGVVTSAAERMSGAEATVESMDVSLFDGSVTLTGFRVANPPGFPPGEALRIPLVVAELDPTSFLGKVRRVKRLRVAALHVNHEGAEGGSNIETMLAMLRRAKARSRAAESPTLVVVEEVVVEGGTVSVDLPDLKAGAETLGFAPVRLSGLGERGGVVVEEVVEEIFLAVNEAAMESVTTQGVRRSLENIFRELERGVRDLLRSFEDPEPLPEPDGPQPKEESRL